LSPSNFSLEAALSGGAGSDDEDTNKTMTKMTAKVLKNFSKKFFQGVQKRE